MVIEKPSRVFCCSANEDEKFVHDLKRHLTPLKREGWITLDADRDIPPGKDWKLEVDRHLEAADIILLLVSPDFMASDHCFNEELPKALARHEQATAHAIPVIVRPTYWQGTRLGKLPALPKDAEAISMWNNRDDAFLNVVGGIRRVINGDPLMLPVSERSGRVPLEKGANALRRREYSLARQLLQDAIKAISESEVEYPEDAAKARYLLVLALLDGKLPCVQGTTMMENVEGLMNAAIDFHSSWVYLRTFAQIQEDFFMYCGYPGRLSEVRDLLNRANSVKRSPYDNELLHFFKRCQPELYRSIERYQ